MFKKNLTNNIYVQILFRLFVILISCSSVSPSENQPEVRHQIIIQHIENGISLRETLEVLTQSIRGAYVLKLNSIEKSTLQELELQSELFASQIPIMQTRLQNWKNNPTDRILYNLSAEISNTQDSVTAQIQKANILLDLLPQ
ncbi:MAG: hypothetical protein WC747_02470 [Candidatus Babeliales bacterium]|jgi:hypothetical protein